VISGCVVLGFCGLGFGVDEKMKMMKRKVGFMDQIARE